MSDPLVCDQCGHRMEDHDVEDREAPSHGRIHGSFDGETWLGLLCPEDDDLLPA
jgi:hypothetical protein